MIFDRELWLRARPLFDELVELDAESRQLRLEQIGAEDRVLRDEVAGLLLKSGDSINPFGDSSFASAPDSPATTTKSADPLGLIGQTVSHFRVDAYLAAGGMGVVYTGEDLQLGRPVALKFPLRHQQLDASVKERFINEARSAAALDHPNVCTVYQVAESEHGVFLAMPFYPGTTLKDRLVRDGSLAVDEALGIVQQITTGLAAAHSAGIVHRDLKPGNVMLLPDGQVKILDFGLAKIRDISLTKSNTTLGTIGYISPEQIRGHPVDGRADLWSLGVMLYEMLTGKLPFGGEHEISILHGILHGEPSPPSQLNRTLSPKVDQLIGTLLQKNAESRYPSADALLADVGALRTGAPLTYRGPFWSRTPLRRRVSMSKFAMAAVAVLFAIGFVAWNMYRLNVTPDPGGASRAGAAPALKFVNDFAVVSTPAELVSALAPENAGRSVRIRAGTYDIEQPLIVPDGMTLEGDGVMLFAPGGNATGFADSPRTTFRAKGDFGGSILTLGNNATIRNLEIVDVAGRSGNVVAVVSRHPADSVSATILESVIVNPNPWAIGASGPLGRALVVNVRNANMGADPAPDEGSMLSARVLRSVIHSPIGGGAMYAMNFASNSQISLEISRSHIGGTIEADGGVSRPDAVHDSEVRVMSTGNVYRSEWAEPCASPLLGWNLVGGSGAPIPLALPVTTRNRLVMRSVDDRIEGFTTAILATASRRFFAAPLNGASTNNEINLELVGTTISTPVCAERRRGANNTAIQAANETVADLVLVGGWVQTDGIDAGMDNKVRVAMRGVTGSGKRLNIYHDAGGTFGRLRPSLRGSGNRVEIAGDPAEFARNNRGIDPAPPAEFFTGGRPKS